MNRSRLGAFAVVVCTSNGCVEDLRLFDVELQVRVADGVDPDVVVGNEGTEGVGFSFSYFPDVGADNGGDPQSGKPLPFERAARSARFELLALKQGSSVARGSSGVLALPAEPGAVLPVPLLLATVNVVGALDDLPPLLGEGSCISADQQGQVFVVGGSAAAQTGYVLSAQSFEVTPLDGVLFAEARPGCSALAGRVVAVSGCVDGGGAKIHQIDGANDVTVATSAADPCGAFAASSLRGFWLFARDRVELFDSNGDLVAEAPGVEVADVEPLGNGDALVLTQSAGLLVYRSTSVEVPVDAGSAQAIGRRFADVVALSVNNEILLFDGPAAKVLRIVDDIGVVTSFTMLSNDSIAAIEGSNLVLHPLQGDPVVLPLPRPRAHVSALPGDTLILAGDEGLDAVSAR